MARIVEVDNLDSSELDPFVRLTGHQLRNRLNPDDGLFIVESPIAIEAALDAGCEPVALLTEKKYVHGRMAAIIDRLGDVKVFAAEHETLSELTGFELTRGALAAMRRPQMRDWRELAAGATRLAVLENIVDTTNMGAIFRCAAGLGIDAVLLTPECCDPLCRRAVRVSMGTALMVPFARIGDNISDWPVPMLGELKAAGFFTAAMALRDDALSVDDPSLSTIPRLAIILGTEGDGLLPETISACDAAVRIPMSGGVDSLNVAAAAAVAFFELRDRKRLSFPGE